MNYILFHKEIPVCIFSLTQEVQSAIINQKTMHHLPLPLKRIFHSEEEFTSAREGDSLILSEDGCALLDFWLNDRTIPLNRKNRNKYGIQGKSALTWMLDNHSCSLDDCYWTKSVDEVISWEDVKLYDSDMVDVLTQDKIFSQTHHYSGVNSTLGGELEKYWFRNSDENTGNLYLCKRTEPAMDILSIREILAGLLYQSIGYQNFCHYEYVYNRNRQIVGCYCPAFTSENRELITAYDLLEEYNYTQQDNLYDLLVKLTSAYGLSEEITREYLDLQTLVDYLITNRDRHQGNIGFLRDPDTLQIIAPAPVFDSGSSEHLEYELPIDTESTRVNGLFYTEKECLDHVSDLHRINPQTLPPKEIIRAELERSSTLREDRIQFWEDLYENKKKYIRDLALH